MSVMGINMKTLRPEPCVEGLAIHSTLIMSKVKHLLWCITIIANNVIVL